VSFNWLQFITLAESLSNQKTEECYRSAISRIYFGVFCLLRNKKGYKQYKKSDVHRVVISAYKNSSDKFEKIVGKLLDELRLERNDADYDDDKSITEDLVERCLSKSRAILRLEHFNETN